MYSLGVAILKSFTLPEAIHGIVPFFQYSFFNREGVPPKTIVHLLINLSTCQLVGIGPKELCSKEDGKRLYNSSVKW